MKVKIDTEENPYVLDYLSDCLWKDRRITALTRKNADFIEAVVRLDSNYRDIFNEENLQSTKVLFRRLRYDSNNYKDCLEKCIRSIDKTNSTHLQSTIDGIKKMLIIIVEFCPSPDKLKLEVCKDPSEDNYDNLFYRLCETMENYRGDKVNNISFASKFISYARKFLNNDDTSFSKYDSVVSKRLSLYEHYYVDNSIKIVASRYNNDSSRRRNQPDEERQLCTYKTYLSYMGAINRVLLALRNDNGIIINREEFDHIVWYSSKGN